jgi:hypothetical protein
MTRRNLVRLVIAGVAIVAVLSLPRGAMYLLHQKFHPQPPQADFPPPANAIEAQRQDVGYFAQLLALDRSFSPAARAEADTRVRELLHTDKVLEPASFRVALHKIAALADNGHTRVFPAPEGRAPVVPLRVYPFADGLYVLRARNDLADLLGARVERIDGRPVADVLHDLNTLQGGTEGFRTFMMHIHVMTPRILYGVGVAQSEQAVTYEFVDHTGATIQRTLTPEALTDGTPEGAPRVLSPEPQPGQVAGWQPLPRSSDELPIALRDFDKRFRRFRIAGSCIMAVQFKGIADNGNERIAPFVDETEREMRAQPPCALILDMRFSTGGDYGNTADWAKRIPELLAPGARAYILTSPRTFSAAITTVAFVKQAMGPRATILGEPVGDRLRFWAEGGSGCLPHAKLCMSYAAGLHDYGQACRDWDKCFWLNWLNPVRVDSLEPDEAITMRFSDYLAGRDPAFERAVALARPAGAS